MKKDICIPEVKDVYMAAILEWSDDFMSNVWNAYLVNDGEAQLHDILVVSKAFGTLNGEMRKTSLLRHAIIEMPGVSAVKIEMIEDSVLTLNNEFMVTYFIGNTLYDRKYIFTANSITTERFEIVPVLLKDGVMAR